MMEIDLPRMQSLSPQFDSSESTDSESGMTNLSLRDIPTPTPMVHTPTTELNPSSTSMTDAKNCDWTYGTDFCGCAKSNCGCKYINKVSIIRISEILGWQIQQKSVRFNCIFCKLSDDSRNFKILKWFVFCVCLSDHFTKQETTLNIWLSTQYSPHFVCFV